MWLDHVKIRNQHKNAHLLEVVSSWIFEQTTREIAECNFRVQIILLPNIFPWRSSKILLEISPILDFGGKNWVFLTIFKKNCCFFQMFPRASKNELALSCSSETKTWIQREDSWKKIWNILGMHPKGTEITKFTENRNSIFLKQSKSKRNLMNARGKLVKSLKKCVFFDTSKFHGCTV